MALMNGVTLRRYHSLAQMEPAVRKAVEKMGDPDPSYHLRHVASGRCDFKLRSALVLFKNGVPIGWTAYYVDSFINQKHCSVWVNKKYRGKGYGKLLMHKGYRDWRRFDPTTHGAQDEVWDALDMGWERISPNASVIPSHYIQACT